MERPTSGETLAALRKLVDESRARQDETMAVLLSGVELYARLGREYELLEVMRKFALEIQPAVNNTPSAEELRRLYERD
jgi:hypothetical protein